MAMLNILQSLVIFFFTCKFSIVIILYHGAFDQLYHYVLFLILKSFVLTFKRVIDHEVDGSNMINNVFD